MNPETWRDLNPHGDIEVRITSGLRLWEVTARWGDERIRAVSLCPKNATNVAVRLAAQIQGRERK